MSLFLFNNVFIEIHFMLSNIYKKINIVTIPKKSGKEAITSLSLSSPVVALVYKQEN